MRCVIRNNVQCAVSNEKKEDKSSQKRKTNNRLLTSRAKKTN